MNFKELIEAFKTLITDEGVYSHPLENVVELYQEFLQATTPKPLPNGIGEYKIIVSEGSTSEGYYSEADDYTGPFTRVFHFTDHDIFVKLSGVYSSYAGFEFPGNWNNLQEVFPTEEAIIVYKPKNTGKMNFSELKIALERHYVSVDSFAHEIYEKEVPGVGKFDLVDEHGGEDEGSNWYNIRYFPDHDIYVKVQGYYQSYNGTSFDDWGDVTEVRPVEKTITVYEGV